jgi:hypothetical protein
MKKRTPCRAAIGTTSLSAVGLVLTACSGEPIPLDAKTDCVQEFVQDFVIEGKPPRDGDYCPEDEEKYPRASRRMRREVHTEFSNGDVYTRQLLIEWGARQDASQGHCFRIVRLESLVEFSKIKGHEKTRVTVNNDGLEKQDDESYLDSLNYLDAPRWGYLAPVRDDVKAEDIEQTEFGLECAWVKSPQGLSRDTREACLPLAPMARCDGNNQMMPIRQIVSLNNERVEGRTTLLKFGRKGSVANRSDWLD